MFRRQKLVLIRAPWSIAAGLAAVLLFASTGLAQDSKSVTKANKAPTQKVAPAQKSSPDLTKARAEVKTLHEQMETLREQMHTTAEKLHKAHASLAKLEGHGTGSTGHHHAWTRHGWGPGMGFGHWASFHHDMMARGPHGWASFPHQAMFRHDGNNGQVEQQLHHLQNEIDQLRRQLSQQTKSTR